MKTNRLLLIFCGLCLIVCPGLALQMPAGVLFVGANNGSSEIYLWQPSSGEGITTALTKTSEKEGNASWWAKNRLILASRETEPGRYGIVALDSSLETKWLYQDPIGSLGWPVPSPWDNRILCVREVGNGMIQPGMITYPDGDFEPFDFNGLSGGQLAWLNPDLIQLSRVTQSGFAITHRQLSTGEEHIVVSGGNNWQSNVNVKTGMNVFVRRVGQIGSIFRLYQLPDRSWEYENLTNARTYDWQPSFSAEGDAIVFRSLRNGYFETIVRSTVNPDDSEIVLPISGFEKIYFPTILDQETVNLLISSFSES